MVNAPRRYEIHLVELDPTIGAEIRKTRPCVVISPDDMNRSLRTIIVAPITSRVRRYPNRVRSTFEGREGEVALDQVRTIDRSRVVRKLGALDRVTAEAVANRLVAMFTL